MDSITLRKHVRNILDNVQIYKDFLIEDLDGGRNNRVYKIICDSQCFLLKSYFWHENDKRDRLGSEFRFLEYAWSRNIRSIAQPIFSDDLNRLALYSFLPGEKIKSEDVTDDSVDQAFNFISLLNQNRENEISNSLPNASEANFSFENHIETIEKRISKLTEIQRTSYIDVEALEFLNEEVIPKWIAIKRLIFASTEKLKFNLKEELEIQNRILSPSDFGFHNAIRNSDKVFHFVDFEYAGWDDPAKLVGDFFNQVEIPISSIYFDKILNKVSKLVKDEEKIKERIKLLLPLFSVKWIVIVLNYFLKIHKERRDFSGIQETKQKQLEKAKDILVNKLEGF